MGRIHLFLLSGNPISCSCESYIQKLWLRRHRKWLRTDRTRGSKVGPQCVEPASIVRRHLLSVRDSELCPLPSVNSLQLSSIKPSSFLVTWESPDTNMTGLRGFIVAYHRLDVNDQVKKFRLAPGTRGFQVDQVRDNTLYLVCVVTRGSAYRRMLENAASPAGSGDGFTNSTTTAIVDDIDFSSDDADDVTASQLIQSYR